jgi:hypothetical protein
MFDTISRVEVRTDLDGRFVAQVRGQDVEGRGVVTEYRTNPRHEGLWVWDDYRVEWKQILGTCQFHAKNAAAMRRKIRRMLLPRA